MDFHLVKANLKIWQQCFLDDTVAFRCIMANLKIRQQCFLNNTVDFCFVMANLKIRQVEIWGVSGQGGLVEVCHGNGSDYKCGGLSDKVVLQMYVSQKTEVTISVWFFRTRWSCLLPKVWGREVIKTPCLSLCGAGCTPSSTCLWRH